MCQLCQSIAPPGSCFGIRMTDHIATMWKYQRTRRHGSEWLTKQRSVAGKRRGGGLTEHDCLFLPYQDLGKPCHLSRVQLPSLRSLAHVIQLMRLVMIILRGGVSYDSQGKSVYHMTGHMTSLRLRRIIVTFSSPPGLPPGSSGVPGQQQFSQPGIFQTIIFSF